jgi:hypothetical protein
MKVNDYNKYRCFDYENSTSTLYELGDIVYKAADPLYEDDAPEIGIILQVHSEFEYRTDMFGNCSEPEISMATLDQIEAYRPKILEDIKR